MPRRLTTKRGKPCRKPLPSVLIVVEGTRTEPQYFKALCARLKIAAEVIVYSPKATDPAGLVRAAIDMKSRRQREVRKSSTLVAYDEVWAVFDQEEHLPKDNINTAWQLAESHKVKLAFSVPSIEFWFLLHCRQTAKPFATSAEVISELRKMLPNYGKSNVCLEQLLSLVPDGVANAQWLRSNREPGDYCCPYTEVDLLVSYLDSCAREENRLLA